MIDVISILYDIYNPLFSDYPWEYSRKIVHRPYRPRHLKGLRVLRRQRNKNNLWKLK